MREQLGVFAISDLTSFSKSFVLDTYPKSALSPLDPPHCRAMSWTEIIDENSGMPYFYNSTTGETTWLRPTGTAVSLRPQALSIDGKRL